MQSAPPPTLTHIITQRQTHCASLYVGSKSTNYTAEGHVDVRTKPPHGYVTQAELWTSFHLFTLLYFGRFSLFRSRVRGGRVFQT